LQHKVGYKVWWLITYIKASTSDFIERDSGVHGEELSYSIPLVRALGFIPWTPVLGTQGRRD
jgi:hypothetical protein